MADKDETLKEDDDKIEIVEVDKIPTEEERRAAAATEDDAKDGDDQDDGEEHEEDARLSQEDREETEGDAKDANDKRKRRRQVQKEARDRTLRRLDMAERENVEMRERIARLEGTTVESRKLGLDEKLAARKRDIADLEVVKAKAIEAGNGDDVVAADRLRDEARDDIRSIEGQIEQLKVPAAPTLSARTTALLNEWRGANSSWYDGKSQASLVAHSVDNGLKAEGWDPETEAYWSELSRRTAARLGATQDTSRREQRQENGKDKDDTRRKEPFVGDRGGADARQARGNEVYVTPERKAAMQEAGIWDDPVRRARVLKGYRDFDRAAH